MTARVIALANQKGGVGKTATALGLASAVADRGQRALVIDMDPQGNATTGVGVSDLSGQRSMFEVMAQTARGSIDTVIRPSQWENVDIAPADLDLASVEKSGDEEVPWRLYLALEQSKRLADYAAVFVDCPPSLGRLMFAALLASDGVLAITEPSTDSVRGLLNLEVTIGKVQLAPGSRLVQDKIVISRKRNTGEHIYREDQLRSRYGDLVARTTIPDLAARMDAHSSATPIHKFTGGKALTLRVAYSDLLDELSTEGTR